MSPRKTIIANPDQLWGWRQMSPQYFVPKQYIRVLIIANLKAFCVSVAVGILISRATLSRLKPFAYWSWILDRGNMGKRYVRSYNFILLLFDSTDCYEHVSMVK